MQKRICFCPNGNTDAKPPTYLMHRLGNKMNRSLCKQKNIRKNISRFVNNATLIVLIVMLSLTFVCLGSNASGLSASNGNKTQEIVHVGFFHSDGYHNMDTSGEKSGYGYDFLQKIAGYANFKYICRL